MNVSGITLQIRHALVLVVDKQSSEDMDCLQHIRIDLGSVEMKNCRFAHARTVAGKLRLSVAALQYIWQKS